jgi:hypothetical protein
MRLSRPSGELRTRGDHPSWISCAGVRGRQVVLAFVADARLWLRRSRTVAADGFATRRDMTRIEHRDVRSRIAFYCAMLLGNALAPIKRTSFQSVGDDCTVIRHSESGDSDACVQSRVRNLFCATHAIL